MKKYNISYHYRGLNSGKTLIYARDEEEVRNRFILYNKSKELKIIKIEEVTGE